ncbi:MULTISPECIES: YncE family protein [Thermoanaerobacterium]|uniref:40-residue YVTN family beta-propeller repeat-containing protein n=2 Tax=Thermoanaerobacterium TaxID=28895 RepID=W9EAQ6_9THEO|nr:MULTISPECIES: YncE family protein [Thermoanaerobacterium]AFK86507.1 40-residue YVTN family beta-propeller repeat protein [Thermoanaerobacterium saccharolyticum JW/SL-YS485]ETO38251.1 40-residue YVTN family beta-propeller repeat-containing protein [Thermoanaerobacterium aotearoense SCUT27]
MKIFVANKGDDTISYISDNHTRTFLKLIDDDFTYKSDKLHIPQKGPHRLLINSIRKELYSLNVFDDSISIIDIDDFHLQDTVYIGPSPNDGMILNNLIYVLNGDADCLTVFDIMTGKIIEQVNVGFQPQSIIYSKKRNKIFVSNTNSDSVSLINPIDLCVEKTLFVKSKPFGMCLSDDEKFLFVANSYLETGLDGSISVYDIINDTFDDDIKCGKLPISVAFFKSSLLVVNSCSNTLMKIDLRTKKRTELFCGYMPVFVRVFKNYALITVSGENKLILVDIENLKIERKIEVGKEPDGLIIEA